MLNYLVRNALPPCLHLVHAYARNLGLKEHNRRNILVRQLHRVLQEVGDDDVEHSIKPCIAGR